MLLDYFRAGFPAVAMETVEEQRAVVKITNALKLSHPGLVTISIDGTGTFQADGIAPKNGVSYTAAFQQAANMQFSSEDGGVLFIRDFHHIAKSTGGYRTLLNHLPAFKSKNIMAVLLAPNWSLPPELAHELPVVEFARPTRDELDSALSVIESSGIRCDDDMRPGILDAASGLCLQEAENAIALSLVRSGGYERSLLEQEKMAMINKSGLLEIHPAASPEDIGGLDIAYVV